MHLYWAESLAGIIEHEATIEVKCDTCPATKPLDRAALERLAEIKGADYSLFNRRCRCKLTEGCPGWNRFVMHWGMVPRHLWDEVTAMRWMKL